VSAFDRTELAQAHRIVVKLGTGVVTHDGQQLALGRVFSLVEDIHRVLSRGFEVLIVSSGAVGLGRRALGLRERPSSLGLRQACAAVGQGHLISLYGDAFDQLGRQVAQVLLTQSDLGDRDRVLCLRTTLTRLLELEVLPILNENDSVSVRELVEYRGLDSPGDAGFGDNDGLSARVAATLDADLLVLLTDVDGLHTANPTVDASAQRIPLLDLDDETPETSGTSSGGTGGMTSKLDAARIAAASGIPTLIASGDTPAVLSRALAGEDLGTLVAPQSRRPARRRHIAVAAAQKGALVVNEGALAALTERKASLLPIGVTAVEGSFERGDVVEVRDGSGRVHGRGLVNYDAEACRRLAGHHSSEIGRLLGYQGYDALVTRDNLVLGEV
jgi:glutamate 5-kinase